MPSTCLVQPRLVIGLFMIDATISVHCYDTSFFYHNLSRLIAIYHNLQLFDDMPPGDLLDRNRSLYKYLLLDSSQCPSSSLPIPTYKNRGLYKHINISFFSFLLACFLPFFFSFLSSFFPLYFLYSSDVKLYLRSAHNPK